MTRCGRRPRTRTSPTISIARSGTRWSGLALPAAACSNRRSAQATRSASWSRRSGRTPPSPPRNWIRRRPRSRGIFTRRPASSRSATNRSAWRAHSGPRHQQRAVREIPGQRRSVVHRAAPVSAREDPQLLLREGAGTRAAGRLHRVYHVPLHDGRAGAHGDSALPDVTGALRRGCATPWRVERRVRQGRQDAGRD